MAGYKHEYSTVVLLIVISVVFLVAIVSGLDIGDRDDDCAEGEAPISIDGVWTCGVVSNITRGENLINASSTRSGNNFTLVFDYAT